MFYITGSHRSCTTVAPVAPDDAKTEVKADVAAEAKAETKGEGKEEVKANVKSEEKAEEKVEVNHAEAAVIARDILLAAEAKCESTANVEAEAKAERKVRSSELIFQDEFEGGALDMKKWVFDIGRGPNNDGWGNGELQYYTDSNATVANSVLTITARNEKMGECNYTSARLVSRPEYSFTYGRVEARLRIPKGQGLWPAFWMLGENFRAGTPWCACGEIDIMEHVNNDDFCIENIHWPGTEPPPNPHAWYRHDTAITNITDWHVYTLLWSPRSLIWQVDGTQTHEANIENNINNTSCFHKPFHILLNLAVGGMLPGAPNTTTSFPATFEIDYVRVYKLSA